MDHSVLGRRRDCLGQPPDAGYTYAVDSVHQRARRMGATPTELLLPGNVKSQQGERHAKARPRSRDRHARRIERGDGRAGQGNGGIRRSQGRHRRRCHSGRDGRLQSRCGISRSRVRQIQHRRPSRERYQGLFAVRHLERGFGGGPRRQHPPLPRPRQRLPEPIPQLRAAERRQRDGPQHAHGR